MLKKQKIPQLLWLLQNSTALPKDLLYHYCYLSSVIIISVSLGHLAAGCCCRSWCIFNQRSSVSQARGLLSTQWPSAPLYVSDQWRWDNQLPHTASCSGNIQVVYLPPCHDNQISSLNSEQSEDTNKPLLFSCFSGNLQPSIKPGRGEYLQGNWKAGPKGQLRVSSDFKYWSVDSFIIYSWG